MGCSHITFAVWRADSKMKITVLPSLENDSVGRGIGIALSLAAFVFGVQIFGLLVRGILLQFTNIRLFNGPFSFFLGFGYFVIGLTQMLWLIPMFVRARNIGLTQTCNGLLVGGGIVLLLNLILFGSVALVPFG